MILFLSICSSRVSCSPCASGWNERGANLNRASRRFPRFFMFLLLSPPSCPLAVLANYRNFQLCRHTIHLHFSPPQMFGVKKKAEKLHHAGHRSHQMNQAGVVYHQISHSGTKGKLGIYDVRIRGGSRKTNVVREVV